MLHNPEKASWPIERKSNHSPPTIAYALRWMRMCRYNRTQVWKPKVSSEDNIKVLQEVNHSKFDWRNSNYVGVVPNSIEDCPSGKLVGFHLGNKNVDNKNKQEGWTGAFKLYPESTCTDLLFCLVDGDLFGSLAKPTIGNSNYAVLLLGGKCPA
jgi:hypothetical protein